MGKSVSRLRLSPLQGQLLRFLEEAGAEDVQTTLATFASPYGSWTTDEIADATARLVHLGLVNAQTRSGTTLTWQTLHDRFPALPTVDLILTDGGRTALTT
jgi:hypothetical protein